MMICFSIGGFDFDVALSDAFWSFVCLAWLCCLVCSRGAQDENDFFGCYQWCGDYDYDWRGDYDYDWHGDRLCVGTTPAEEGSP